MDPDTDIPVATATLLFETDAKQRDARTSTLLATGRSSRVILQDASPSDTNRTPPPLGAREIQILKAQGFPMGLIHAMHHNAQIFPMRIWVVDNSGSMSKGDGHRIAESLSAKVVKLVNCSRWSELQQTVEYHAEISGLLKAPTVFRLLNDPGRMVGPQQFSIAERGEKFIREDIEIALKTMGQASPSGCTPLSQHLVEIRQNIMAMLPQLQSTGQKVAIILATDGLPTNAFGSCDSGTRAEFENNLRSLAGLPVWVVVRLCTDEESVVEYYNNLDSQLELSLEVLDDWIGEAQETREHNPWLNYGLCLHRIRELGFHHRLLDLLDERPFNIDELREFLVLLFGLDAFDGAPDANLEFNAFLYHVKAVVSKEGELWNPVSKRMGPWVDVKKLKSCYGDKCSIM